jgi:hypothetical protein
MEQIQEQQSPETNISILSSDPDKIEKYKALLQKVIPIIQNSTNKMERRAGYDFNILLKAAINETNNTVWMYLNDAIEHVLRYFAKNLDDFLNGKEDWENYCISTYGLLNDLAIKIMQSLLYKDHLQGFRKICLEI